VAPFPLLALPFLIPLLAPDVLISSPPPTASAAHVAYTCRWSFPGGSPSTSASCSPPPVRYRTPGIKPVTLTVCVDVPHGACSTATQQITVLDPQPFVIDIKADPPDLYVGDTLRLTAVASGKAPLALLWNLPRSTTATRNPVVVETAKLSPGILTIRLRVTNSFGASTRTLYLRLQDPKPTLTSLSLSSTTPILGSVLHASPTLTGRPPLSFLWTLDGRSLGTNRALAWEVAGVTPGPHTLRLKVSNATGSASLARTVTVLQPLIRDFRPVCPNLLCLFSVDTAVAFDLVLDPSAHPTRYDYDWIGNGTFTESSPAPVARHIYTEPGNYRPRVRIITSLGVEAHPASQFLLVTR
jgi:PKD repeat protein